MLAKCARSTSIDSYGFIVAIPASGSLLRHLYSIYTVSDRSNSPNSASTRSHDLVGPLVGTDVSRSRFDSSTTMRRVRLVGRVSMVGGRWCGRPMCVRHPVVAPSVLTCLDFSQWTRVDSFRVAACAVLSALSPIRLVAISVALALPTALGVSRLDSLARMATRPSISTRRVRFFDALVSIAPGAYPIVSGAVDNISAVPNALDNSRVPLQAQLASWPITSTRRARFAAAAVRIVSGAFLCAMDVAWYGRFAARLVWLLSRSTW